MNDHRLRERIR